MSGTLVDRGAARRRAARPAISFRTLFLAPTTRTSPREAAPPATRNLLHAAIVATRGRLPTRRSRRAYAGAMVNLTRIYTRTGDDGTTAPRRHEPDRARPTRGWPPTPTSTRPTPHIGVALAAGELADDVAARAAARPERPVRRRRRPVHPGRRRPASTRRCGSSADYVDRLEAGCDQLQRASCRSCARSSCPAAPPGAALPARRAHGRAGGPSGRTWAAARAEHGDGDATR